ncbi:MAG TPA: Rne/Rng family ribonuclease [Gaiellaceae bacterium]|nr:Rne/Rng family ribonuclease [Gaiellaceae bacterium]
MPWFRRKKREEGAPAEAAPEARAVVEETPPPQQDPASAEAEDKPARKRRRGSRGGRGRKRKLAEGEAGQASEPVAEEKPAAKPRRARESEKPATRSRRKPDDARRRRKTPTKRIDTPDVEKEIYVSVEVGEQRVAILEEGKAAEVYLERRGRRSIAGNVYKGIVDNVLPGMEASFVEIGLPKNGFLYVDEIVVPELEGKRHGRRIQDLVQRGQEVLVQAVKDPMGTKGARLTTEISLPGRFLVYTPFGDGIGISRRLEDAERDRLKAISKALDTGDGGIIVRTAAEGASKEELEGDLAFLRKLWGTILARSESVKAPALVYQEAELPLRIIRDLFNREVVRVVVDHERTHRRIVGYLKRTSPQLTEKVELYAGKQPLMEKTGVEEAVRSTLNRRVDLPSGGYLIFDYAEAFTVIDVNTGRFVGARVKASGARLEDTITKNNLEAVAEVVRQLRLRDIGGIIVIDFIDMANPKNRELVEDALTRELERDRTKTYVVEISPLGLVEMTRQNVTDGPREILTVACPTCAGDGIVVSDETQAIEIERRLRNLVRSSRSQAFRIELNSHVAAILIGPGGSRLDDLEQELGRRFVVETKDGASPDHFEVVARGPAARAELKGTPVTKGEELEVAIVERDSHFDEAGVGRLDKYLISVAGAANQVGKKVKARIERTTNTAAYGVLAGAVEAERPVDPETELEALEAAGEPIPAKPPAPAAEPESPEPAPVAESLEPAAATERPTRQQPVRKPSTRPKVEVGDEFALTIEDSLGESAGIGRAGGRRITVAGAATRVGETLPIRIDEVTARAVRASINGDAAEQPVAAEPYGAAPATGEDGEPKPKKRTRRGSRGGRGRKKKPPVVAGTEDPLATNGAEPTGTADAGEASAAELEPVGAAEPSENGAEKPKKKTRRGSRGGRNRRKKAPAADVSAEPVEPVPSVAGEEESG